MDHPIISNRKSLAIYFAIWTFMAILHGLFLYRFYDAGLARSIVDSFIFNLFYSMIGLGLWYTVRFSQMEDKSIYNLFINHLAAMAITLVVWLFLGYYSIYSMPVIKEDYFTFFQQTLMARVLVGIMEYILVTLVYYVIMYYQNFREKITRESALESNIKTAELSALKSQINPHFLFNSLNSISALTIDEPEKARDMVQKLSVFLRDSIAQMDEKKRRFDEEIVHISHYLDIEKVRFGDRLVVGLDIAKKCNEAIIPHMILQPLVENAVKHGVGESTDKVYLKILADCFHGFLKVQIENNYDPEYQSATSMGIGMENIRKRLGLIYNREDLMTVTNENHTFRVTLNFPQKIS